MGQGLEPLTADLCLSSRSQPPQLPSRADFFEQSKKRNVFRASTATTTTTTKNTKAARAAAAQLQPQLLLSPLRGPSTTTTTTTLVRKPLPARTWIKWHQTARPRTLTASGIGCSVTRVPRATTRTTRVHRRPPARVTVTTTGIRTWTNCQQRWPQQREQWQQKGHQGDDDDDTRSRSTILSSMLPDFPSNANTMEFG